VNDMRPGDQMALPDGKSCIDCKHLRRCAGIIGIKTTNTTCDFYPSRFAQYQAEAAVPTMNPGTR